MPPKEKEKTDDESTRTLVREALSGIKNKQEYRPTDCQIDVCNFERKFEEQWNKRVINLNKSIIGWVAGSGLSILGCLLAVYISFSTDIVALKKDMVQLQANQITQKELGQAIQAGLAPLTQEMQRAIDQIQKQQEINIQQDREIYRLGLKGDK